MTKIIKYVIILSAFTAIGFAQLKSELRHNNPSMINLSSGNNSILSLFDPSRFSMNHSFSMSMMNMNSQSIGVASYTNNMNFTLRDNLRLQTNMTFMQPKIMSADTYSPYSNTQLYFDAVLDYQPTENTHLQVSFGNYPQYGRRQISPFFLNRGY